MKHMFCFFISGTISIRAHLGNDSSSVTMSCRRHCTHILIKLSPHQHPCCISSLIASFYSIKPPIFAVFIHISPCFFSGSFVVSSFCTPNNNTAEPDHQGHVVKAKERMGGKSFSGS